MKTKKIVKKYYSVIDSGAVGAVRSSWEAVNSSACACASSRALAKAYVECFDHVLGLVIMK